MLRSLVGSEMCFRDREEDVPDRRRVHLVMAFGNLSEHVAQEMHPADSHCQLCLL
jgi:hypothetical protein